MQGFRQFVEALRLRDAKALGHIAAHPLMAQTTFGVEVEFICCHPDVLKHDSNYEGETEDYENEDLTTASELTIVPIQSIMNASGYRLGGSNRFNYGPDGHDNEDGLPIMEIRSSPLAATEEEFNKFENFLNLLADWVKNNSKMCKFAHNTGLHVHVSNPDLKQDFFSRLSASLGVDEDKVWNDMAPLDRDFNYARMHNHEDYERFEGVGKKLVDLLSSDGTATKIFTNEQLQYKLESVGRYNGVNFNSVHPTVEYRYLSSMLLLENDGIKRTMDYIKYFINHSISRTKKNQFRIGNHQQWCIFTRLPNGRIRVDCHDLRKSFKVPQTGKKNTDLRDERIDTGVRPESIGMTQWKKEQPFSFDQYLRSRKK